MNETYKNKLLLEYDTLIDELAKIDKSIKYSSTKKAFLEKSRIYARLAEILNELNI